jgi:hypothetical protein
LVVLATALPLPGILEFDDEAMIVNHKTIVIVKHRNVGHEQPGYPAKAGLLQRI